MKRLIPYILLLSAVSDITVIGSADLPESNLKKFGRPSNNHSLNNIVIDPDSIFYTVTSPLTDSTQFTIQNIGLDTVIIYGFEAEEIPINSYIGKRSSSLSTNKNDKLSLSTGAHINNTSNAFGYIWRDSDHPDGPVINFIDISSSGTVIGNWLGSADDGIKKISLPFDVNFYGNSRSYLWVSTNGFVSFDDTLLSSYFTNSAIPVASLPNNIIAVLWDDLNGNNPDSKVFYQTIGNRFIIQWSNWGRYNHTGANLNF